MSAINQRTPPFPLLALPKELRLKIYEEALCINKHPIRTNQHPSIPRKYHLIRRTTPGFYRPYTCQQMMSSPGGLYPGRVFHTVHPNAMPPITQVGGLVGKESLELFTKTKLLFELDDMHGMSAWNLVANAFLVSSITTAHAIAPAMAIIESGQGSVPDRCGTHSQTASITESSSTSRSSRSRFSRMARNSSFVADSDSLVCSKLSQLNTLLVDYALSRPTISSTATMSSRFCVALRMLWLS